jgi:hypothetical protein
MAFASDVADEARYHHELARLSSRVEGRRLDKLVHDGVRFSQMLDEADELVPLVARAVADGSYRPAPARVGLVRIGKKERSVARVSAIDLVVHGVVAQVVAERIEPLLSDRLYSYRRGRSSWQAVRWLASLSRAQRRAVDDVRARGLYVLRADVADYTDSIPTSDDAPLFGELFAAIDVAPSSAHASMLRRLLRPSIDGEAEARTTGLLFGLPTTNVLGNAYLAPLDRAMEALGGAYARYGDDVLFTAADPSVVREARATLERVLEERRLAVNAKKLRVLYWNGAPRPSAAWPEAVAARDVPFLGAAVRWGGTIALAPDKWRAMLADLRARIRSTASLLGDGASPEARARAAIAVVNDAFDVRSPLALAHAALVKELVSDRGQLEELDYLVAAWIAEAATDRRGPRAFRDVGWRWLRQEGLVSRVAARNAGR